MKIGIDISQIAYENTGVANFTKNLVENLLRIDKKNQYVLFFSSMRKKINFSYAPFLDTTRMQDKKFTIKTFKLPPTILDILWNRLHILPIESFIGDVDIFISSDWTQPPTRRAKRATILYDLIVYKFPEESHNQFHFNLKNMRIMANIVASQKRRLHWVKNECHVVFCISESTKKDAMEILGIKENRLKIIYPGVI